MINTVLRSAPFLLLAIVLGCTKDIPAPPLKEIDRIMVGGYHVKSHSEIAEPETIGTLVAFANERRARNWSCCGTTKHGEGGVLLHFYSKGTYQGYFGVHGPRFFTKMRGGDATLEASSPKEIRDFLDLVPSRAGASNKPE